MLTSSSRNAAFELLPQYLSTQYRAERLGETVTVIAPVQDRPRKIAYGLRAQEEGEIGGKWEGKLERERKTSVQQIAG